MLVERRTRDRKIASSNPGRSGGKIFLLLSQLSELTFIRCPFHPRVTVVARKRPGHSAKSAGGIVHLSTHTPLTQRSQSGLTMLLSRHSVGTYSERRSCKTCQGTFSRIKSEISVCKLISTSQKKLLQYV